MGRYARAVYGTGKYGLDLRAEHSVEPMTATIEVDTAILPASIQQGSSAISGPNGQSIYDRVMVTWLAPKDITRYVLMRSNVGFPTGPTDPWAKTLMGSTDPLEGARVSRFPSDPSGRERLGYLDEFVEQGREYFYSYWVMTGVEGTNTDEWNLAGRAMVTTSTDHGTLEAFKNSLPAYMWNRYSGPGEGVAVLPDDDDQNTMSRWLQCSAWELDKAMTKVDLMRKVWDPQFTPAILLDDAISMFGLPVEPSLGARSARALLANASRITGDRGSMDAVSLLVESLSGMTCDISMGANLLPNPDEGSFEGLLTEVGTDDVIGGTGRWHIGNATLTRIYGAATAPDVRIARDTNPEEYISPSQRYGLHLTSVNASKAVTMTLGSHIKVNRFRSDEKMGTATTAWPHGLETGDTVLLSLDGLSPETVTVKWVIDQFTVQFEAPPLMAFKDMPSVTDGHFSGGRVAVHQGIPVSEGAHTLSVKFRAGGAQNFSLKATFWNASGAPVGTATAAPTSLVGDTWVMASTEATAPSGAVSATLEMVLNATGSSQWVAVDDIMLAPGSGLAYEDARLLTLDFDPTQTPTGGLIPFTIQGDMIAVLEARLTDILTQHLPVGTAFRLKGLVPEETTP